MLFNNSETLLNVTQLQPTNTCNVFINGQSLVSEIFFGGGGGVIEAEVGFRIKSWKLTTRPVVLNQCKMAYHCAKDCIFWQCAMENNTYSCVYKVLCCSILIHDMLSVVPFWGTVSLILCFYIMGDITQTDVYSCYNVWFPRLIPVCCKKREWLFTVCCKH